MRSGLLVPVLASVLVGCGSGFLHDEQLDESYRLVAIDTSDAMILCRRFSSGDCVGDELPGPTVFAAGANARYVVLARHPSNLSPPNKAITEYYYVIRPAETVPLHRGDVVGPLGAGQFAAEGRRLGLPAFSRVFADLR